MCHCLAEASTRRPTLGLPNHTAVRWLAQAVETAKAAYAVELQRQKDAKEAAEAQAAADASRAEARMEEQRRDHAATLAAVRAEADAKRAQELAEQQAAFHKSVTEQLAEQLSFARSKEACQQGVQWLMQNPSHAQSLDPTMQLRMAMGPVAANLPTGGGQVALVGPQAPLMLGVSAGVSPSEGAQILPPPPRPPPPPAPAAGLPPGWATASDGGERYYYHTDAQGNRTSQWEHPGNMTALPPPPPARNEAVGAMGGSSSLSRFHDVESFPPSAWILNLDSGGQPTHYSHRAEQNDDVDWQAWGPHVNGAPPL